MSARVLPGIPSERWRYGWGWPGSGRSRLEEHTSVGFVERSLRKVEDLLREAAGLAPEAALPLVSRATGLAAGLWSRAQAHERVPVLAGWGRALHLASQLREGPVVDRLLAEAAEKFLRLLELEPDDAATLLSLAILRTEQAMAEEADTAVPLLAQSVELFEAHRRLEVPDAEALAAFGRALVLRADFMDGDERRETLVRAARAFQAAHRREPAVLDHCLDWAVALGNLASVCPAPRRAAVFAAAERAFERATTIAPDDVDPLVEWAGALLDEGMETQDRERALGIVQRAVGLYERAVACSAGAPDLIQALGVALTHRAALEADSEALTTVSLSVEALARAAAIDGGLDDLAFNRGYAAQRRGELLVGEAARLEFLAAARFFGEAVIRVPADAASWAERGASLVLAAMWTEGDEADDLLTEAEGYLQRARELGLRDGRLYHYLGHVTLERALRDPMRSRFLLQEACDRFETAAACPDADDEVALSWGRAASYLADQLEGDLAAERFAQADGLFLSAAERAPDRHDVLFHHAIALRMRAEKVKDRKAALEHLWRAASLCRQAVAASPDDEGYAEELGYVEELLGGVRS